MTRLNQIKGDDICALSTPVGRSAIAVVRTSGPRSLDILKKLIHRADEAILSHKSYLAYLYSEKNEKIDQALVTFFKEGHSYTGEASFEISCHGNPNIVKKTLDRIIELGARQAEPGEFTFRAFINNKIDLVQAEAVLSLIESQNESAAKISLRQLEGQTSAVFKKINSDLTWCLAHIEASIDFSTEGIDVVNDSGLIHKLKFIQKELAHLVEGFSQGQIIKHGLKIALLGKPNAGKSSLLNQIVQAEKAIVTEIAGTTRDVIEVQTQFNGMSFIVSDTAGLRETQDRVEQIGVNKSIQETQKSDINLLVVDAHEPIDEDLLKNLTLVSRQKFVILCNKADLLAPAEKALFQEKLNLVLQKLPGSEPNRFSGQTLFVSSLDLSCRNQILNLVLQQFESFDFLNEAIVSSSRQIEMVRVALGYIGQSVDELETGLGSEFVAQTLKDALLAVQKVLGEVYDDQILDRVFKEFCLGK